MESELDSGAARRAAREREETRGGHGGSRTIAWGEGLERESATSKSRKREQLNDSEA